MIRGIYAAASGMTFEERSVDVIANNLANLNTTGFKREEPVAASFKDVLIEMMNHTPGTGDTIPEGVQMSQIARDETPGGLRSTGDRLDVALTKPDQFFLVRQPDGTQLMTRDGSFTRDAQGQLVTAQGNTVQAVGGGSISLPTDLRNIKIHEDGTITNDGTTIAQIQVVAPTPADLTQFPRVISALQPATGVQMRQGYLESSNVNAVTEMVRLIEDSKLFNFEQKAVSANDQMLQSATQQVGKTS